MDVYQIWVDGKPGVRDHPFLEAIVRYLGALKSNRKIDAWRLLRRKLGLGPASLGQFQALIETRDLAQLDQAFKSVSQRAAPVESADLGVSSRVANFQAGLWRDFPETHRQHGEERF
jgi:hypothetical protein